MATEYIMHVTLLMVGLLFCMQRGTNADFMVVATNYDASTTCKSPSNSTVLSQIAGDLCSNYIDFDTKQKRSTKFNCQTLNDETFAGFGCTGTPIESISFSGCMKSGSSSKNVSCVAFPNGYVISFETFNNTVCKQFQAPGVPDYFAMTNCYATGPEPISFSFMPASTGLNGTIFQVFPSLNCTGSPFLNQTYQFGKCDNHVNNVFFGNAEGIKFQQGSIPEPVSSIASADNSVAISFLMFVSLTMRFVL
jgi:hypothetical protein